MEPPALVPTFVIPAPNAGVDAYDVQEHRPRRVMKVQASPIARKVIAGVALLTIIILLLVQLTTNAMGQFGTVLIWVFAGGLYLAGLIGMLLTAFRESSACGLMYLFVPFYGLYYLLTRFDDMKKPFGLALLGWAMLMGQIFVFQPKAKAQLLALTGTSGGSSSDSSEDPYKRKQYTAPVPQPAQDTAAAPTPAGDAERERIDRVLQSIAVVAARDFREMSREQAMRELATLKTSVKAERAAAAPPAAAGSAAALQWQPVDQALAALEGRLTALPSEAVDPSVFAEPAPSSSEWPSVGAAQLGEEISFHAFRLRPPVDSLIDLTSSEADEQRGLSWVSTKEHTCVMLLRQTPKADPRQRQPWLINRDFQAQAALRDRLLTIDTRETNVTPGTMDGIPFWRTRVVGAPGTGALIRYVGSSGNNWIIAEIHTGAAPTRITDAFDNAIRSLRLAKAGEPKSDPFSPARVAPRLADKPEEALALLRLHKSAAEPVVLPLLTSAEARTARAAAIFLQEFGTARAAPDLRKAAESSDPELAATARAALKRIAPTDFDAVSEWLIDLKSTEITRRDEALKKLATATPDPKRRQEVAALLENMILAETAFADLTTVATALARWHGDKTVVRLLPILSREDSDPSKLEAAIEVVSATHDKAAAAAVLRWLKKEPAKAAAALIRMGAVAEEPVVKLYNTLSFSREEGDVIVRADCVRILSEVAVTSQSLTVLTRAARDPRDVPTQEIAKAAIDTVKARIAAAATKPVTPKPM
jgi:hypothetical protein